MLALSRLVQHGEIGFFQIGENVRDVAAEELSNCALVVHRKHVHSLTLKRANETRNIYVKTDVEGDGFVGLRLGE